MAATHPLDMCPNILSQCCRRTTVRPYGPSMTVGNSAELSWKDPSRSNVLSGSIIGIVKIRCYSFAVVHLANVRQLFEGEPTSRESVVSNILDNRYSALPLIRHKREKRLSD